MDRPALPAALGLVFGLVIGVLTAYQQFAPVFFAAHPGAGLGTLIFGIGVVTLVLSPFGTGLAGYWLAGRLDFHASWLAPTLVLFGAAFVGALVGFGGVVAVGLASHPTTTTTPPWQVLVLWRGVTSAVSITVPVVAGAGIRGFGHGPR